MLILNLNLSKYKKESKESKVLLLHLLLNNYDINQIKLIKEETQDRLFGLKLIKVYGITTEKIDFDKIEEEIKSIKAPIICYSPASFECNSNEPEIYIYTPENEKQKLAINDMGIISNTMLIEDNTVISSHLSKELSEIDCFGFNHFKEYVLNSEMKIGKWQVTYKDNVFNIYCQINSEENMLLLSAIELDKTSTYFFVIYIINHLQEEILKEGTTENYKVEKAKLVVKDSVVN